jgi:hypothetical protein
MTHGFMRITSEGGYIGRLYWGNTRTPACPTWGKLYWMSDTHVQSFDTGSTWAGSVGIFRYMTLRLRA